MKKPVLSFFILFFIFFIENARAHCPLCTAGAAAAAGGAALLGVNTVVIGMFLGGFAVSLGFWFSRIVKREYFKFQKPLFIILSFILTIVPLMPLLNAVTPIPVWITGDYGSVLNRTYIVNNILLGSLVGAGIVSACPWLSHKITALRKGKTMPFQGTLLTLFILLIAGIALQVLM